MKDNEMQAFGVGFFCGIMVMGLIALLALDHAMKAYS